MHFKNYGELLNKKSIFQISARFCLECKAKSSRWGQKM